MLDVVKKMRLAIPPALVAIVALLVCCAAQDVVEKDVQGLIKFIESKGGKIGYKLGKDCPTCPRGAIATKNYKKDDIIAEVPFTLSVKLGLAGEPAPEAAMELIRKRFHDPTFNKTHEWFWKTQPGLTEVFTPDVYTDEMVDMLDCPKLEKIVRSHLDYNQAVFQGEGGGRYAGKSLKTLLGGDFVSMEQFSWYCSLIVSRAFSFWTDGDLENDITRTYMFPGLDMINHGEGDDINCYRWEESELGVIRQIASKDIKKGEQLYQIYHADTLHRPDASLLVYGFVMENDPPLLAAVDLPSFHSDDPYKATPLNDDAYGPRGEWATGAEMGRLWDIKRSWKTTLEHDEKLLKEGADGGDWRKRTLLQFSVMRKRALVNTLKSLKETLGEL